MKRDQFSGFEELGHGCGGRNKYGGENAVTGYKTFDFRYVSVYLVGYENKFELEREMSLRISESAGVIEDSWEHPGKNRTKIRRILLLRETDDGYMHDIVTYDGGNGLEVISAKTLETAIEFEKWSSEPSQGR